MKRKGTLTLERMTRLYQECVDLQEKVNQPILVNKRVAKYFLQAFKRLPWYEKLTINFRRKLNGLDFL